VTAARDTIRSQLNNDALRGLSQNDVPQSSLKDFEKYFGQRKNFSVLLGTSRSWFFLDVVYCSLDLNNIIFLQRMDFRSVSQGEANSIYAIPRNGMVGNLILVCAGAIPESLLAILLVDRIGRRPIQIGGFAMIVILLWILGGRFEKMNDSSRVALFVLCLFFINFGEFANIYENSIRTRIFSTDHTCVAP
jgi:MFS transporter, PHS family, inorganic phosphate transporter